MKDEGMSKFWHTLILLVLLLGYTLLVIGFQARSLMIPSR